MNLPAAAVADGTVQAQPRGSCGPAARRHRTRYFRHQRFWSPLLNGNCDGGRQFSEFPMGRTLVSGREVGLCPPQASCSPHVMPLARTTQPSWPRCRFRRPAALGHIWPLRRAKSGRTWPWYGAQQLAAPAARSVGGRAALGGREGPSTMDSCALSVVPPHTP